jgi:hypothetical protein
VKRPAQQRRGNQRRRPQNGSNGQSSTLDVWHQGAPLPPLEPIRPAGHVVALIKSLGEPPLPDGIEAGHYFESVVERAANIASALAFSVDLLDDPRD